MRKWVLAALLALVAMCGVQARAEAPDHRAVIKARDTLLFAGDSLVSESAWTREVSAGVLRVRAGEQIRTYRAAWGGAIVAGGVEEAGRGRHEAAAMWLPRMMLATRATVLVAALGWDDALRRGGAEGEAFEREFEEGLESALRGVRHRARELYLVTPPADGPAGVLTDRERARLASVAAATVRVAGRLEARVIALHEGAAREGLEAAWEAASGTRLEGAASMVAASHVLQALGFSGEELSRVGWAPCPEPVFERAQMHLAMRVIPAESERGRTFRLAGAISTFDGDHDLLWKHLEMRLSATHEHRENILAWQRMEVERDWLAVERIATATEDVDMAR